MYVGVYMPVCSYVRSRVAYAYVKHNLSAYEIHILPHITKWHIRRGLGNSQMVSDAPVQIG